jgi:hypothetical protein
MPSASIGGRVVNLAGQPLANATLHVSSSGAFRTTSSDADGGFLFYELALGRYSMLGECPGYHQQPYGIPLSVADADHLRDIVFTLIPAASISGKIIQADGSPASGVHVLAQKWISLQGRRRLFPRGLGVSVADGSYRIDNLAPGRYYLSAQPITDPSQTTLIEVAPGADLRGFDLQIRTTPGYRVRGTLVPHEFVMVNLLPLDGVSFERPRRPDSRAFSPTEGFEFHDVPPGRYAIQASPGQRTYKGVTTQTPAGRLLITVIDSDLDDLVLHLAPALELRGRVTIEGVEPPELLPEPEPPPPGEHPSITFNPAIRPWVTLQSVDGVLVNSPGAESREDGTFHVKGIIPAKYRANVHGVFPPGAYLKSIHLGDRDVTDAEFEIPSNAPLLHVVFSPHAASISGMVRDSTGKPIPGATVSCWDPHRSATTDQKGAFAMNHFAPGEYCLLAWDCSAGDLVACDLHQAFESRVTTIALQENSRENIELQAVPRAEMEAAAAKIR